MDCAEQVAPEQEEDRRKTARRVLTPSRRQNGHAGTADGAQKEIETSQDVWQQVDFTETRLYFRLASHLLVVAVTGPSTEALEAPQHERPDIRRTGQQGAFLSVEEPSNHQNATPGEALEGKRAALEDMVDESNSPQSSLCSSPPWRT